MRITPVATFAVVVAPILWIGCTSPVDIYFDGAEDFGNYRTWDWLPSAARTIDAPTPYAVGLDRELAELVERELARRGFRRVRDGADLRLGALLNMRREEANVMETRAIEQISSLHSSPNFEVQATVTRVETYERYRLVVFAVEPRSGRIVWKGALEERFPSDGSSPGVRQTVTGLLAHFPAAGDGKPVLRAGTAARTEFSVTTPRASDDPDA